MEKGNLPRLPKKKKKKAYIRDFYSPNSIPARWPCHGLALFPSTQPLLQQLLPMWTHSGLGVVQVSSSDYTETWHCPLWFSRSWLHFYKLSHEQKNEKQKQNKPNFPHVLPSSACYLFSCCNFNNRARFCHPFLYIYVRSKREAIVHDLCTSKHVDKWKSSRDIYCSATSFPPPTHTKYYFCIWVFL